MTTLHRADWEEAGYRVADHTTSPPVDLTRLDAAVLHYPAAKRIGTVDAVEWFRAVQRSYVDNRGYSIGYNFGYWLDGLEFELRGLAYRNAANNVDDDPTANERTVSFLVVVAGNAPATGRQVAAIRNRRRLLDVAAGRVIGSTTHRDLEPTGCPGTGIFDQQRAGIFEPPTAPEDEMPLLAYYALPPASRPGRPHLVVVDGSVRYRTNYDTNRPDIPEHVIADPAQYDQLLRSAGLA